MEVVAVERLRFDGQGFRMGAHIAERSSGRLLHDFAQLSGQDQLSLARHHGRLDMNQLATAFRPGQTERHADFIVLLLGHR